MKTQDRRRFLLHVFGGMTAAAMAPAAYPSPRPRIGTIPPLGPRSTDDEAFWQLVKEQFPLRPDLILMNAANLCPSPYSVSETVTRLTRDVDADASFQNRSKFGKLRGAARRGLARFVGADADEIAITRNTSEGNNTVISGLALGAGDEVVIWDQNHPTNNVAWDVRAARYGFEVTRVSTPALPDSEESLVSPFRQAVGPRTKVLAFSHVSNISGVRLPAKALCGLGREHNVVTLVDGAQSFGAIRVNLHEMGCDFYTGSTHKWFLGPKETGLLFVRRENIARLWPNNVGVGWQSAVEHGARKFDNLGQRDDAAVSAIGATLTFHDAIGADRIEARVLELAAAVKSKLQANIPELRFHTPREPELSAGVVVFSVPGANARELFDTLYTQHNIGCAAMGGDFTGIRLSPHIYNTMQQVDRVVAAISDHV
ncbi:MAG: aminotransferase class V-fold PLP-dependent enzyme [Gemmatimonadales bacterium]